MNGSENVCREKTPGMIALYFRLSLSDGDIGSDDKDQENSIENQKNLLREYLVDHPEITGKIEEYVDDGYTGANFNRPAFRQMIEDCQRGIVKTILVKDLSRLGKNDMEVGDYIEQLFPMLGIRFISVTQKFDSKDFGYTGKKVGMQMDHLAASLYSRNMSQKQKSTRQSKRKQGIAVTGAVPYGYKKDPEEKGKFCIDPEAAKVVRRIFEMAMAGCSLKDIAEELNEEGIETPHIYNKKKQVWKNLNSAKTPDSEDLWNTAKVRKIIQRYDYTGAFVEGRSMPVAIGNSHKRKRPESEWAIIDGVNEAIVTLDEYQLANEVVKAANRPSYCKNRDYLLKGKVKCGTCRLRMSYGDQNIDPVFYCVHKMSTGRHSSCSSARYSAAGLEQLVFYALKNICQVLKDLGEQIKTEQPSLTDDDQKNKMSEIDMEISILHDEKVRQYEVYTEGKIDRETYVEKKRALNERLEILLQRKEKIQNMQILPYEIDPEVKKMLHQAAAFSEKRKLTKEMVDFFIREIFVQDEEHIKIIYKQEEEIRKILELSDF